MDKKKCIRSIRRPETFKDTNVGNHQTVVHYETTTTRLLVAWQSDCIPDEVDPNARVFDILLETA